MAPIASAVRHLPTGILRTADCGLWIAKQDVGAQLTPLDNVVFFISNGVDIADLYHLYLRLRKCRQFGAYIEWFDISPFLVVGLSVLSFAGVPPFGDIVACSFFDGADMSIQPKNIKPSAGPEVFVAPYIMSEDVPIVFFTTAPLSIIR